MNNNEAAIEAARQGNGQFGRQPRADADATLTSMTEFTSPYPTLPVTSGEMSGVADSDFVTCTCGNNTSDDGFSTAARNGQLASIRAADTPDGLADFPEESRPLAICNACGRVIDENDLNGVDPVPVIGRIDVDSQEWSAARELYLDHIEGF